LPYENGTVANKKNRKGLTIAASFEIGPGHRDAMKGKKIYEKGKSTDNKNEKEIFLKKAGPQLPLAKKKKKKGGKSYG